MLKRALFVLFSTLLLSSSAFAQDGTRTPVEHKQMLTVNPILVVFGWFNAEYERKINETTTWAVSGSMLDIDELNYRSIKAHVRYYPQGAALTGFFLGAKAGFQHVSEDYDDDNNSGQFGTFGVDVGYNWLLGKDRKFAVSLGAGAERLFGGDLEGVSFTLPTIRVINIGIAF